MPPHPSFTWRAVQSALRRARAHARGTDRHRDRQTPIGLWDRRYGVQPDPASPAVRSPACAPGQRSMWECVLQFVRRSMALVAYRGRSELFDERRHALNEVLAFAGLQFGEDGELRAAEKARTLSDMAHNHALSDVAHRTTSRVHGAGPRLPSLPTTLRQGGRTGGRTARGGLPAPDHHGRVGRRPAGEGASSACASRAQMRAEIRVPRRQ